ncbi:MAG: hypothetical protein MUF83_00955 [Acidimicrobiales bacterium]|nr:hypothetical protein [Acidimicrobiales bacterium]
MGVHPNTAGELALAVLPRVEDLWSEGWVRDLEPADTTGAGPLADTCLPETFPEDAVTAALDATFVHDTDGIVVALVTVFATAVDGERGWDAVRTDEFAVCLTRSVLADLDVPTDTELLGPVFGDGPGTSPRPGGRTRTRHAVVAVARGAGLSSLELDLAAVGCGPVLVLLWAAHPGSTAATRGWTRLVQRVEDRSEAAVRSLER